jgi:1-pyrroline-5-carboxylate dehydrogenase
MGFRNEDTFQKYVDNGNEKGFHKKYEQAVSSLRIEFGKTYPLLIGGKSITTDKIIPHFSPIDRQVVLGYIRQGSHRDVDRAIKAARLAFDTWGTTYYKSRIKIMRRIVDMLRKRKFELAAWLSFENGKNRYEAVADADEAIDFVNYYIEEMILNRGFVLPGKTTGGNEKNTSVMKPYGVWAIIAPFNFPVAILVGMTIGALITGNTVVIKPASDTPIIGYQVARILIDAGLREGVVNFVMGPGQEVGKVLVESKDIAGIVFTGSREVGYELLRASNELRPRPVVAELGGKNAAIVTQSADIDKAVEGIVKAAFSYSAQKCSACSRVYVQKAIKSEFTSKLIKKTQELVIGNPINAETNVGPLINEGSIKKFERYSKLAAKSGRILIGGFTNRDGSLKRGYYAQPTIIDKLPKNHMLFKDELFVPILCISEYDKFADALSLCNATDYGLTAGIYTNRTQEIEKFLKEIEAGVVYVNRKASATTGAMVGRQSFGGWKDSGTTGKGTGGKYYLTQFMREQSQTIVK